MRDSSKEVVLEILNRSKPKTILDAPCGKGWLADKLTYTATIDGIDLFEQDPKQYRVFRKHDLDYGLPDDLPKYDAVISCEGIEHFGNPDLFLKTAHDRLASNGMLLVTTPNVWYPAARMQYLLRGFFPSFPCLTGKISRGTHMHIMPWSFPQLYLYLKLNHFENIKLHWQPLSKPKHSIEKVLALPQKLYCKNKAKKSNGETKQFWETTMSEASLYGRNLIVTATKP